VAIARWITLLITGMQFMSAADPGLDLRVIGIVGIVTVATVLEFALVPALEAARRDPLAMIRGSSGARIAGRRDPVGPVLVVAQVAVSLVLLASAATLARTFQRQSDEDPGFDTSHLLIVALAPRNGSAVTGGWEARTGDMTKRVASLPGVTHVAIAAGAPLGPGAWYEEVTVDGHSYGVGESRALSGLNVGPGYFAAIGAAMVRGREFTAEDRTSEGARSGEFSVAVVNEAMARRFWPGDDPIGKQLSYRNRGAATVVGVVRDMHDATLAAIVPRAYFPLLESPAAARFELIVHAASDPAGVRAMLRPAITSSSPPVESPVIQTMSESLDGALSLSRAASVGLGTGGTIALLLTSIGLYGLVASWSADRRREIGIRIALGAEASQVRRLLVGGVARLIVVGTFVGVSGALAAIRLAQHLYGPAVEFEAWPLAAAFLLLAAASALAAYIPSRRATAVDPASVLRND
jgi:predicted permease